MGFGGKSLPHEGLLDAETTKAAFSLPVRPLNHGKHHLVLQMSLPAVCFLPRRSYLCLLGNLGGHQRACNGATLQSTPIGRRKGFPTTTIALSRRKDRGDAGERFLDFSLWFPRALRAQLLFPGVPWQPQGFPRGLHKGRITY